MARKIQIDIEVNGKMQKATVSAKKLRTALDGIDDRLNNTAKSAHNADRRLKGAAQASANGTKNFSKMAQGISGGLVPAYATLAAQVFAVSAVFQFLRSASDTANLIAGQQALAATTGIAYKSITNSIKEATDGQLSFAESAKAAAIGTASGLNPTQLAELGRAAKNASIVLGRDLTDSFNRLIRGVTKAEPELLDELGIILRLETATERYKNQLGIAGRELTAFERTQAVANEVLGQAEQKFAAVEAIMDPSAASLNRFLVSFEELINTIKTGVIGALRPVFDFLSENTASLTAALTLFALPIVRSILPAFGVWEKESREKINRINRTLTVYEKKIEKAKRKTQEFAASSAERKAGAISTAEGILGKDTPQSKMGRSGADFLLGRSDSAAAQKNAKKILDNAEAQIKKYGAVTTGYLKGKNAEQVADLRNSYATRMGILKGHEARHKASTTRMGAHWRLYALQGRAAMAQIGLGLQGLAAKAAAAGAMINAAFGWIGLLVLAGQALYAAYQYFFPVAEAVTKAKQAMDDFTQSTKDINEELGKTAEVLGRGDLLNISDSVVAMGNALTSANLAERVAEFGKLDESIDPDKYADAKSALVETFRTVGQFNPEVRALGDAFERNGYLTEAQSDRLSQLTGQAADTASAIQGLAGAMETLDQILLEVGAKVRAGPFARLGAAARSAADLSNTALAGMEDEYADRRSGLATNVAMAETTVKVRGSDEDVEALKKARKELEAIDDEMEAARTQNEYLNNLAKEYEGISGTLLENERTRGELGKSFAEAQTLGRTEAEKIANLEAERFKAGQAILSATDKVTVAKANQNALTERSSQQDKDSAAAAVQAAEDEMSMLLTTLGLEEQRRQIRIDELETAKEIRLQRESMKPLELQQQVTAQMEKQNQLIAEQQRATEQVLNARLERVLMSTRSEGGYQNEEQALKARIKLEEHMVKVRQAAIMREYRMKLIQIDMENKMLKARNQLARAELLAAREKTNPGAGLTEQEESLFKTIDAMADKTRDIAMTTAEMSKNAALETVDLTLEKMQQKLQDLSFEGQMAAAFEGGVRTGIGNAFQTLKEGGSLKDAVMGFIDGIADAALAAIEKRITDSIMEALFGPEEGPAEKMEKVLQNEPLSKNVGEAIEDKGKKFTEDLESALSSELEHRVKVECCDSAESESSDPITNIVKSITKKDEDDPVGDDPVDPAGKAEETVGILGDLGSSFMKLLDSLGSFGDVLKDLGSWIMNLFGGSGGGGFGDIINMVMGFFGFGGGARYGGIMSARYGAVAQANYAAGGIARGRDSGYPAILHGTEAVVPLPHGNKIPVELKGAGGTQNNVGVTVNINNKDESETSSDSDSAEGEQLGRAIAAAVQKELITQKRAGGMLSPYGVQ